MMSDVKLTDILTKAEIKDLKSSGITISDDPQTIRQELTTSINAYDDMKTFHNKNMLVELLLMTLTNYGTQSAVVCNSAIMVEYNREDDLQMRKYIVNYTVV